MSASPLLLPPFLFLHRHRSGVPPSRSHPFLFATDVLHFVLHHVICRHPSVKWAQSSDVVFITIELPDAKDVKLKLEPEGKFSFSATKDGNPYEVDLDLFDTVKVEESKHSIGMRSIVYAIQKEEKKWWSRLLKQEGKPPVFLKVDWDKWVDEDEENGKGLDLDDMDFSKLDMGGDDDFDDLEEITDEEEVKGEDDAAKKEEPGGEEAEVKEAVAEPAAQEAKA